MHLTLQTDYSIRILMYLGAAPTTVSSVSAIAGAFNVSHNHLVKVARLLTQLGLVKAVRGRTGGLTLGMPPADINIGAVVRRTEPHMQIAECFAPDHDCAIVQSCALKHALAAAQQAFFETLDGYSLATLIQSPALTQNLIQLRARSQRVPGQMQ
jgi:Rrf2 family nitric oxide-sensitive transcriptional repressor